jgi:hypothetical protein
MYVHAACPDFGYAPPDERSLLPTLAELAYALRDESSRAALGATLVCPATSQPPPPMQLIPLLVLPVEACHLVTLAQHRRRMHTLASCCL